MLQFRVKVFRRGKFSLIPNAWNRRIMSWRWCSQDFSKRVGTIQWSRDRESPSRVNWSERIRHFEVARRPGQDGCQSALWDCFGGTHFQHGCNFAPKTVPQCTFSWQPSRPGLPRNLKVANIWEKMLTLWSNQQRSGVFWLSKTSPVLALIDSPWTRWSGLASQSV